MPKIYARIGLPEPAASVLEAPAASAGPRNLSFIQTVKR